MCETIKKYLKIFELLSAILCSLISLQQLKLPFIHPDQGACHKKLRISVTIAICWFRNSAATRKLPSDKKQKSSKILVRNVPFEATQKELRELFATFGELKTVRLPKKISGTGAHRGFAFIDFLTKQDAKVCV